MGSKGCHFGQFGTINARYNSCFYSDLINLGNQSKMIEKSLFAIFDLLLGAMSVNLYFSWRVGVNFFKKKTNFEDFFFFIFL